MCLRPTASGRDAVADHRDAVADHAPPAPCSGILVVGAAWPLAELPGSPMSLAMADLNGDGKSRILVTVNADFGTVSVTIGKGDGTFAARVDYATVRRDFRGRRSGM